MSNEKIELAQPALLGRRVKDRRDGRGDMANLLYIMDRHKAIAADQIKQNQALRGEIKILRMGKQTWLEISIASWLTTLAIVITYLIGRLA